MKTTVYALILAATTLLAAPSARAQTSPACSASTGSCDGMQISDVWVDLWGNAYAVRFTTALPATFTLSGGATCHAGDDLGFGYVWVSRADAMYKEKGALLLSAKLAGRPVRFELTQNASAPNLCFITNLALK